MKKTSTAQPHPDARVHVTWLGGERYDMGRIDGPHSRIDASDETGPGPIGALLGSLATCSATDIVSILAKARTPAERLTVDVVAERVDSTPRRLKRVALHYHVTGVGIEEPAAKHAIELALTKYCSVRGSLHPAIAIDFTVAINTTPAST